MQAQERIIREIFSTQQCEECGENYPSEGILILIHRTQIWVIMARCYHCQHKNIYVVAFTGKLSSYEEPTSFSYDSEIYDVSPQNDSNLVNEDDVVDMHNFLQHFKGDFSTLFANK